MIEKILAKCSEVDYVVHGDHSYLAKVPPKHLNYLAKLFPQYFNKSARTWHIQTNTIESSNTIIAAMVPFTILKTPTSKSFNISIQNKHNNIEYASFSKGKPEIKCKSQQIEIIKEIKYSSLCNCLSEMYHELKKDKSNMTLKILARLLCNLYSCGKNKYTNELIKKLENIM